MARMSVNWGSTPDISAPMQSLGAALAGAMGGGGRGSASQSRAARDAAYMESLQHHNSVYDAQADQYRQKIEADKFELQQKRDEDARKSAASSALGEAAAGRIPHPPLVLSPNEPAIVQYNRDSEAARLGAPYVLDGGGNADVRAKGFKEYYNPMPVPVETKPEKPIIQNGQAIVRTPVTPENPSGLKAVPIPGVVQKSEKETDQTRKAAGFVERLEHANRILEAPDNIKTTQGLRGLKNRVLDAVPFGLGRSFEDPGFQQVSGAEKDMGTAVLRDESGATILDSEFGKEADKYLPQYSDTPETARIKSERRAIQLDNMRRKAGLQPKEATPAGGDTSALVEEAKAAIAAGADPAAVKARLQKLIGGQ